MSPPTPSPLLEVARARAFCVCVAEERKFGLVRARAICVCGNCAAREKKWGPAVRNEGRRFASYVKFPCAARSGETWPCAVTPKFAAQVLCWPLKITMQNGHCPNFCDDPAKRVPSTVPGPPPRARLGAAAGGGRGASCMKNGSRVGDSGAVLARGFSSVSSTNSCVDEGEAAVGREGGGAVGWWGGGVARSVRHGNICPQPHHPLKDVETCRPVAVVFASDFRPSGDCASPSPTCPDCGSAPRSCWSRNVASVPG